MQLRLHLNSSLLLVTIAVSAADVLGEILDSVNNLSSIVGCRMTLLPLPSMNPIIRTDKYGRSCRGNITVPICYGYCKSSEGGTHTFPHREQKREMCTYENPEWMTHRLTDCDFGADESIRDVKLKMSNKCRCQRCDDMSAKNYERKRGKFWEQVII